MSISTNYDYSSRSSSKIDPPEEKDSAACSSTNHLNCPVCQEIINSLQAAAKAFEGSKITTPTVTPTVMPRVAYKYIQVTEAFKQSHPNKWQKVTSYTLFYDQLLSVIKLRQLAVTNESIEFVKKTLLDLKCYKVFHNEK